MKYILILLFFACFSCSDKKTETEEIAVQTEPETIPITEITSLKKDSLMLDATGSNISADKVVITELKRTYDKDSIGTAFFTIDFFKNAKKVYSHPVRIDFGREEGAEWSINQEFMTDSKQANTDKRFVHCDNGIAACGYTHTQFLFFLGENGIQLVSQWDSMWDSGYGVDSEFTPDFKTNPITSFVVKTVDVSPDETVKDTIDRLVVSYSDSTRYNFENGKWIKNQLSEKGKVYRTEKFTFDEYHKQ